MKNIFFTFFSISFLFIACQSDNSQEQKANLQGKWTLESAYMNSDSVDILSGTVFSFTEDKINSNLLTELGVSTPEASYKLENNKLIVGNNEISFDVKSLDPQYLKMSFEIAPDGTPVKYDLNLKKD